LTESAIKQWGGQHAEIKIMEAPFSTCSLKNSALYYGVTGLDPSFEAVVIVDADTNPSKDWLKQLVEPLADPRFPAATGLRWYVPDKTNAGSLVRYLWNAAAIVQQNLYRIPWGGSLALRRDLFTKSNLLERWKNALSTDTLVKSAVKQAGGSVAVVPSLFLVNRETCGLRSFHRWVQRQLLVCKLYHSAWGAVLGQAVLITLPLLLLAGTFFAGAVLRDGQVALWSLISFLLYWAGVFGTLPFMERAIRRIVRQHGEVVERWTFRRTLLTFAMIPLTQLTYVSALFWLHFFREVDWRGIRYEIRKDKTVRMIEYVPYIQVQRATPQADEAASL
jgi:cellulose synthase/poly-beta-1,6-N-acetylglucosamine synthase-like glycosyltransferase